MKRFSYIIFILSILLLTACNNETKIVENPSEKGKVTNRDNSINLYLSTDSTKDEDNFLSINYINNTISYGTTTQELLKKQGADYYLWDGKDFCYTMEKIKELSKLYRNQYPTLSLTEVNTARNIEGREYYALGHKDGVVLLEKGKKENALNINLREKIKNTLHYTPLLIFKKDENINLLVSVNHKNPSSNEVTSRLTLVTTKNMQLLSIDNLEGTDYSGVDEYSPPILLKDKIYFIVAKQVFYVDIKEKQVKTYEPFEELRKTYILNNVFKFNEATGVKLGLHKDLLLLYITEELNHELMALKEDKREFLIEIKNKTLKSSMSHSIDLNSKIKYIYLPNIE